MLMMSRLMMRRTVTTSRVSFPADRAASMWRARLIFIKSYCSIIIMIHIFILSIALVAARGAPKITCLCILSTGTRAVTMIMTVTTMTGHNGITTTIVTVIQTSFFRPPSNRRKGAVLAVPIYIEAGIIERLLNRVDGSKTVILAYIFSIHCHLGFFSSAVFTGVQILSIYFPTV